MKVVTVGDTQAREQTVKRKQRRTGKKSKRVKWSQHRFHKAKVKGNFLFMLLGIPTDIVVLTQRGTKHGRRKGND